MNGVASGCNRDPESASGFAFQLRKRMVLTSSPKSSQAQVTAPRFTFTRMTMSDKTLYVKEQNCHPSTPDSRLALYGGTKGRAVLNSAPAEEVILTARSRAIRQNGIGTRFILSTSVIVLIGFLMFLTCREFVSEFDAAMRDFASSPNIHERTDSQSS